LDSPVKEPLGKLSRPFDGAFETGHSIAGDPKGHSEPIASVLVHPDENRRNIVSGSIALVDAHHRDWLRRFFPFKKAGCDTISI
jgi:hypothetical protein